MQLSRSKKRAFALVLAGFTGLMLLFVCEAALRWHEHTFIQSFRDAGENAGVIPSNIPGLNYTLRPNHQHEQIVFNEHGFNMVARAKEKSAGTFRVFFVGDSVTQGVGIESTPEAFPNLIDAKFSAIPGERTMEAWNAGVGGYNAEQVLLFIENILPAYSPDAIVYTFNFNDYWEPNQYFYGQPGIPPDELQERGSSGLLDTLKKYRTILFVRDQYNKLAFRIRGYAPVYVDQKIDYPSWKAMKDVIAEMKGYCESNSISFAVIIHPNKQFLHVKQDRNRAHRDILSFLAEQKIPTLDLLPELKPHRDHRIYLPDGNHMTPDGYAIMAESIFTWLVDQPMLSGVLNTAP